MNRDFSFFELGIERIARSRPAMPKDRVVLNRLFFFIFRQLEDAYNRRLAEFGLNSTTFLALAMLYSSAGSRLNPSDLSEVLISSRTNVTRLADELVGAGWVSREASTEDRRRIELSLTETGRALMSRVLPAIWALVREQWADFSSAEVAELDRLLRKLVASLADREGPQ